MKLLQENIDNVSLLPLPLQSGELGLPSVDVHFNVKFINYLSDATS